jgi:hypothetical protein
MKVYNFELLCWASFRQALVVHMVEERRPQFEIGIIKYFVLSRRGFFIRAGDQTMSYFDIK